MSKVTMNSAIDNRSVYSSIMRLAREKSKPANKIITGSIRTAAYEIWNDSFRDIEANFDKWWHEVHFEGTKRKVEAAPPVINVAVLEVAPEDSDKPGARYPDSSWAKYVKLAESYDDLPSDEMLAMVFNCTPKNISGIRVKLRKQGWRIERTEKGWHVAARWQRREPEVVVPASPMMVETDNSAIVTAASVSVEQDVAAANADIILAAKMDTIINLLERLVSLWEPAK